MLLQLIAVITSLWINGGTTLSVIVVPSHDRWHYNMHVPLIYRDARGHVIILWNLSRLPRSVLVTAVTGVCCSALVHVTNVVVQRERSSWYPVIRRCHSRSILDNLWDDVCKSVRSCVKRRCDRVLCVNRTWFVSISRCIFDVYIVKLIYGSVFRSCFI